MLISPYVIFSLELQWSNSQTDTKIKVILQVILVLYGLEIKFDCIFFFPFVLASGIF